MLRLGWTERQQARVEAEATRSAPQRRIHLISRLYNTATLGEKHLTESSADAATTHFICIGVIRNKRACMFGEESEGKWVQNTVGHVVFTIRRVVKTDRQQE